MNLPVSAQYFIPVLLISLSAEADICRWTSAAEKTKGEIQQLNEVTVENCIYKIGARIVTRGKLIERAYWASIQAPDMYNGTITAYDLDGNEVIHCETSTIRPGVPAEAQRTVIQLLNYMDGPQMRDGFMDLPGPESRVNRYLRSVEWRDFFNEIIQITCEKPTA